MIQNVVYRRTKGSVYWAVIRRQHKNDRVTWHIVEMCSPNSDRVFNEFHSYKTKKGAINGLNSVLGRH